MKSYQEFVTESKRQEIPQHNKLLKHLEQHAGLKPNAGKLDHRWHQGYTDKSHEEVKKHMVDHGWTHTEQSNRHVYKKGPHMVEHNKNKTDKGHSLNVMTGDW